MKKFHHVAAYSFELAKAKMFDGTYYNWGPPQLSYTAPHVPEGSMRNLIPLYDTQFGDLEAYARRQWDWSAQTFGPGERTGGITQHIEKECTEIRAKPHDLSEWVDVMILAMDGFWRHGGKPEDLMPMLQAKQDKNFARNWPDWRKFSQDQAIEHDRSGE